MNKERIILGLDIGVGSIGWGLVKIKEEEYCDEKADGTIDKKYRITDGKIIDKGVRTFQIPQDRQKKSLALKRGNARRSRRTTRRKAKRIKNLVKLATEFNLIENNFNRDAILKPKKGDKECNWDIWTIRKEALERKLSDTELFRILYHIAKHRGFHFHTKAEFLPTEEDEQKIGKKEKKEAETNEKEKEDKKVKKGLRRIQKMLKDGGYKTVGQMFCEKFKQTDKKNKRKRNAKDKYENAIHRNLLKEEIEIIFDEQQKLKNSKSTEELKQRYINEVLMSEEGIDDNRLQNMMSRCEFVPGELCAPKEGYTSERFTLFNRLNTMELVDTQNSDKHLPLDDEQRKKIEALAYKNNKVTFAQIRKELELENDLDKRFNLCSYREKNPEYNKKLECKVNNRKLDFEEKHKLQIVNTVTGEITVLDKEIKGIFKKRKETWKNAKNLYVYYYDIRKQLKIPDDFRFSGLKGYTQSESELVSKAKYIQQFEDKDTFVELKGYHKIRKSMESCGEGKWDELKEDTKKLDIIAEALVYHKSDETRTKYLKEKGITDKDIIEAALTIGMKQLANHSKEALGNLLKYMDSEQRMLFNDAKEKCGYGKIDYDKQAILQPYHGFFENNPAVARVISQTRKLVNALLRKYKKQYTIDQIHIEVAKELASSEKRKNQIRQGQNRYREDKKAAAERCREWNLDPEEGQNLLMFRLAEQQNNKCPYTNKTITFYTTGADDEVYVKDCEIDHITPMSRSFNDSLNNKVLCSPEANQNKTDRIPFEWFEDIYGKDSKQWIEFKHRVEKMYGIPYPKRKNLLRISWTEKDKEKFLSRNLNDTRYATRHIADYLRKYFDFSMSKRDDIKDVSRIQLRSGGITAFLRHMWGLNKNREENDLHHAIDALVVACSTYGHVYLVSNLAKQIERKGKNWYKHFGRDKFKPWDSIRDDIQSAVNNIFVSRMPRHTVTAAAHKDTVISKETTTSKRVIEINRGYAEMGDMVRADVFVDEDGRYYAVPIYSVDIFTNKPLPDKYVPHDKTIPYAQWPSIFENNLKFKFSLFKDDLIGINDNMCYVSFFEATTVNINVENVNGSIFPDKKNAQDPYIKKIGYRPKSRTRKFILKKCSVDILGNYKEVKQENRLGNRFQNGV
ncbi:MAG TPA: type II CRISPR RNA-guided endonuclease Cas9 [Candidatus Bathyarchaeia archaeon]|nr:type II CRISPR RNA-guided endonuclease Cas9 [Candidatus Bathyarchaeia archaeon]